VPDVGVKVNVGVVSLRRRLAVIVPVPRIVAVVDADEELAKAVDAESLLHDEKT
jgi:hypothetical protein